MLRIRNKNKFTKRILMLLLVLVCIIGVLWFVISGIISLFNKEDEDTMEDIQGMQTLEETNNEPEVTNEVMQVSSNVGINSEELNQWNLKLVNKDNSVDSSYVPELEEIDDGVMFDKRAITYLKEMINAMYKDGITAIWVASAYRSYEKQEELFKNKVEYYIEQGEEQEEAEKLAQTVVQRPEMSEHNLGLAADFNTVTNEFEETKAFQWLQKNAQDYGFILRYPKDKQDITGITYESWHWRYVGEEHAKIIKENGYCLEEYIDYLKGAEEV